MLEDIISGSDLRWYEILLMIFVLIAGFVVILPIMAIVFMIFGIKRLCIWIYEKIRDWVFGPVW